MTDQTIQCPHCGKTIELSDALSHQIRDQITKDFETKLKEKDEELMREKRIMWEKAQIAAKKQIEEKNNIELKQLQEELQEKSKKLEEANKLELQIRKERRELMEDKKNLELTKQRELDSERKKITEESYKAAQEELHLKEKEKDKIISDLKKSLEDAQRKASQGSQQLQGEVQELELEELLRTNFPYDSISEVSKGVRGADAIQTVKDKGGRTCGTIIWESKRTKAWSDGWVAKLKEDQRTLKAEIAVLVTEVLPTGILSFGFKDGVWITDRKSTTGLSTALRMNIMHVSLAKQQQLGKNNKMEQVYGYLTGTEFRQRVEAIVEAFSVMKEDLEREKRAFVKMWASREKQIQHVIDNTVGMYGDLQGMAGEAALPEIKNMSLPLGDSEQNSLLD